MRKQFKKTLSLILSLIMIMSMFAGLDIISFAEDDILSYLTYEINDGEVTITRCDKSISGDITIPDTIEGYPVTTIGAMAFSGCSNIQSLKIGNNVNTIYEYAFYGCDNLTNIYIPASVTNIREEALLNIKNVENFIVDKENKNYSNDESGALFNKEKTKLIQYPAGNKSETYSIPETVEKIGYFAFSGVSYLKEVYIPAKVSDISESLFKNIKNIEKIIVDKNNKTYESDENGVLFNKGKDFLLQYPAGKPDAEYVVPEDVAFSTSAFYNCKNLKTITISQFNQSHFSNLAIGFIKTANTLTKIEGFTIKSFKGSLAEEYAATYGFNFIAIEEYPEEPPVDNPPVDNPPVDNPPVEEPPVEEPVDDGKLNVKGEGGIVTDFENKISQIGKEETVTTLSEMINNENFAIVDKNGKALGENALVGTGSKIQILDSDGNIVNEYTILVPTDVDGNGKTTAADARLALRSSAQLDTLDGVYYSAADANGDGKVNASDARKILRISAGLEK